MVKCVAVVENPEQRENLRKCLNIVGVAPCIYKEVVCVSFNETDVQADKIIEIFEQYPRSEIRYIQH